MANATDLPAAKLLQAILDRLKTDLAPDLPTYDEVPEGAKLPYVELGDHEWRSADTKTSAGWEATHEVHVWSSYRGMKELNDLVDKVIRSLTRADLEINGNKTIHRGFDPIRLEDVEAVLDGAPVVLKHALVRQRLKTT